jgi:leucyl aminopeptidase
VLVAESGALEVLVGLGAPDRVDRETLRRAGAAVARSVSSCSAVAIDLRGLVVSGLSVTALVEAVGVGALLASYGFDRFKSDAKPKKLASVVLVGEQDADFSRGVERAQVIASGVALARDLVNTPAGSLTPSRFAEIASEAAAAEGLEIAVLGEAEIVAERLGGLLGVAAGSAEPPRFITITYNPRSPAADDATVAIVGKGITFDSGGLSLKTAAGMMTMKTDMSGAAAVLSTMVCLPRLDIPFRVIGYMALTENMPGGRAIKPGDVLTVRNGKTIEVLNTDAEGRLVLADALSLAVEQGPDAIVDLATLTGACVVALGNRIAGLLGNDDRLIAMVRSAGLRSGEALWPLPIPSGYRSHIDSEIADMKNIGATGQAGALSAALLLEEFVGSSPWVHLDIAGPARSEEDKGYLRKGGTGFGVRTLIELLENYQPLGGVAETGAEGIEVLT